MSNSKKWDKRFMQLSETVAEWSSCYQSNRHVGAVIVKDNRPIRIEEIKKSIQLTLDDK